MLANKARVIHGGGNAGLVAFGASAEAGNSLDIVFKHYRELVEKTEGERWFALTPSVAIKITAASAGKVVSIA